MIEDIVLVPHRETPPDAILAADLPKLPVELGRDVRLERFPQPLARKIMESCERQGDTGTQSGEHLYTFVRQSPPGGSRDRWDPDHHLQACVAISRLVRPTSIGFKYSARLRFNDHGQLLSITPVWNGHLPTQASVVLSDHGDWLSEADVTALGELWREIDLSAIPDRLRRALWLFEYALRTPAMSVRWILMAAGIEALMTTQTERAATQFAGRFCALAYTFAGLIVPRETAFRAYAQRVMIPHDAVLGDLAKEDRKLYVVLEAVLQTTLRACLADEEKQEWFSSADAVDREWPVR
ncbi:MAG TPA: hypothetical protein VJO34_11620 [Methylomirabilota bacterium]|nr:hypothetical protein [Methylomirabilota bacterium]